MKPLALAALALGIVTLAAFAQTPQPAPQATQTRGEGFRGKMEDRMDRALRLTDAQKASVKEIRAKHRAAVDAKMHAAKDARKAFGEAMHKPETKPEDLKTLHAAMASADFDLLMERRAQRQEIKAILTPEQRERAARLEGRMEGMRMGHRGGMDGDGPR